MKSNTMMKKKEKKTMIVFVKSMYESKYSKVVSGFNYDHITQNFNTFFILAHSFLFLSLW